MLITHLRMASNGWEITDKYFKHPLYIYRLKKHETILNYLSVICQLPSCLLPTVIFAAMKILMVCLGNICRSPLAEGILQDKAQKAGLDWRAESAGTQAYDAGSAPHRLSQKVAKYNGVDISKQCCRKFVKEDLLRFDKIYVMDDDNYDEVKRISKNLWDAEKVDFLLNEIHPGKNEHVPDPYYGDESDYHEVYKMISDACDKIIAKYSKTNVQ